MGKKTSKRVSYEERGDHTWELLDAIEAGKAARSSLDPNKAVEAMRKSWDKSMEARHGKGGR
jgi:hypothetical protein